MTENIHQSTRASISLLALPEKFLSRKPPRLSGICPTKAFWHMFGVALAFSLVVGLLSHYGGEVFKWLGSTLNFQSLRETAAAIALCSPIVVSLIALRRLDAFKSLVVGFAFGLVIFLLIMSITIIGFIYCLMIGIVCGLIVTRQGVKAHCRNARVYAGAGVLNGIVIYSVHLLLIWLKGEIFHPLGLPIGPSWIIGAIETALIVLAAAIISSSIVSRFLYCETHSVWYQRKWKQGRFLVNQNVIEAVYWAFEHEDASKLESLVPLAEETYPFLTIRARSCPGGNCDVQLSATMHQKQGSSTTEENWFNIMVPSAFGNDLIRMLGLQEELPPLKKPKEKQGGRKMNQVVNPGDQQGQWTQRQEGKRRYFTQKAHSLLQATEILKSLDSIPALTYYIVDTPDGALGRDIEGFYTTRPLKTENLVVDSRVDVAEVVECVSLRGFGDEMANQQTVAHLKSLGEYARLVLLMECGHCGYQSPVETQEGEFVRECYRCGTKNQCDRAGILVFMGTEMVSI